MPGDAADPLEAGGRIYHEGKLPSGEALRATVEGDVPVSAQQLVCAKCHRRSGMGSSEGGTIIPPINGTALFAPKQAPRRELAGVRGPGPAQRPAYTPESLVRAIREGIDPNGGRLNRLMPRYQLSDDDAALLIGYLHTLSATRAPGVTDTEIHFATVVTPNADPAATQAMLSVLNAYVHDKNAQTRLETRRAGYSPWHKTWQYHAYRKWILHVWKLDGPPADWAAQLDRLYAKQPVFALLSGVGAQPWASVHTFCERRKVPCLFPNTDLPPPEGTDFYSVYFSAGLPLEAASVARHLRDHPVPASAGPVVQVFRDTDAGRRLAGEFKGRLSQQGRSGVRDRVIDGVPDAAYWQRLQREERPGVLVVWLPGEDLRHIGAIADSATMPARLYASATLVDFADLSGLPTSLRERTYLARRFALRDTLPRHMRRASAWLRAKHLPPGESRVQADTYFAATVAGDALAHIRGNFYRDYFMERIEHMLDNAVWTSVYPDMSLAPGQRVASKGCYIVSLGADGATWIVP